MATTILEREAIARRQILEAFESICPAAHGNPFIPHWPTPPQQLFLGHHLRRRQSLRVHQCLYGGAAGGGKSDALLMAAAQYAWQNPEFAGILFRRSFMDLALPGAIMDRALDWWRPRGVHWSGDTKTFTFPSGAKISFGYLQHDQDHLRYKGAEFQFTGWDEVTDLPLESQYSYVGLSRVRRRAGSAVPLRTLAATNPGGPGHAWVKRKFIGDRLAGIDPELPYSYIPARIRDNPHLDQDSYIEGLRPLHPTVREQLLNGDWTARDPGDYFRREWFGALLAPEEVPWNGAASVRWWDLAASEKDDAKRTAGVHMIRTPAGVRIVVHAVAFRATPGRRDDLIVQQAQIDGHRTIVGIEVEPGSGGIAQYEAIAKRLKPMGFRAVGVRPQAQKITGRETTVAEIRHMARATANDAGKEARADPVASCLERGYQRRGECANTGGPWWGTDVDKPLDAQQDGIRLVAGPWTQEYLDEIEGFPNDGGLCDQVDATSGAWAYLESHPVGLATAPPEPVKPRTQIGHDVHPEDRDGPGDLERNRSGHWRP